MGYWQLDLARLGEYLPWPLKKPLFGREDIDWMPYTVDGEWFRSRYQLLKMFN